MLCRCCCLWILFQVLLMLFMCRIEWIHIHNSRLHCGIRILDLSILDKLLQLVLDPSRNLLLLLIVTKNGGRVLSARIIALAI